MTFADATALEQIDDDTWRATIAPRWDIAGAANGGYLLAIAARAGTLATGRPDPVTITGHYLAPVSPGPVTVTTDVLRSGRRLATVQTTVRNTDGKPLLTSLGSFGELGPVQAPERVDALPPDLPPPDQCIPIEPTETFPPPFMAQVELRLHPEDAGFAAGSSHGIPQVRGWFRWRGGEALDTLGLLVAADAFPPTIFNANLPVAWTPTIELTTHVRRRPDPDAWLQCTFRTRFITSGFLEEDGELWDRNGWLVAQSRQLALVPRG